MTDPNGSGGKRPLAVYAIVERNERSYWLKIGAAFTNRDGSTTVYLDAVPVGSNRLQIREQRSWEEARPPNGAPGASAGAEHAAP